MKVKVDSSVTQREVQTKNGPATIRNQMAYLFTSAPYPQPFKIRLEDTQPPYDPSKDYELAPSSFGQDDYGGLAIKTFDLALVEVPASKEAAK